MKDYKRNDPRFWFIYTKFGRVVSIICIALLIIYILLDYFKIL